MEVFRHGSLLLGRIAISILFLWAGITKIQQWESMTQHLATKLPYASLFLPLIVLFQLLGALCILLGFKVRFGALLLILFIIPAAVIFHDFWNMTNPDSIHLEKVLFMKDLGIFGGLLVLLGEGGGKYSLDHLL